MSDQHHEVPAEKLEPPVSVSHFFKVIRAYLPIIGLSLATVGIGYVIVALALYIHAPSQRVTTMAFRLEFEGADRGTYPNGTKFSSAEIISTPVLVKTFKDNNLSRFTTFQTFARSVFVLESSGEQDTLAREYQSRLSDPRLTAVDRERIQREYELKLASLSKAHYALNYLYPDGSDPIPATVVRKFLHDVLREWADFVSHEQHVLEYRVPVLSPDMVVSTRIEDSNPIISTEVLRAKIIRVIANIDVLRALPAADLVRSTTNNLLLNDIQIRLDDIVRFRLEPLIHGIAAGQLDDRSSTVRFLETQLAYDERQLERQKQFADAALKAMAMYSGQPREMKEDATALGTGQRRQDRSESETVMPQINDTFFDRLLQIASSSADREYRQRVADRYRDAAEAIAPLEQAVEYDRSVLALVRGTGPGGGMTREAVQQQIVATRQEVRQLVIQIHQIYKVLSANLNPSTELITVTGPPTTRVERTMSITRIALYGLLTLFIAFPIILFACLIHNRIREEDAAADNAAESNDVAA
jgi:hypothetical protein